jgi:hypothetical protein
LNDKGLESALVEMTAALRIGDALGLAHNACRLTGRRFSVKKTVPDTFFSDTFFSIHGVNLQSPMWQCKT